MRRVSVQGILAPEGNPCVPHSGEIWGLHQEENTSPTPLYFIHVPLRLDAHKCAYVASQSRSHINCLGPPRSPITACASLLQQSCFQILCTLVSVFSPSLSRLYFLFKGKELMHHIFKIFFPHLCISKAVTLKDTLQMSAEFLYCLQQLMLQS